MSSEFSVPFSFEEAICSVLTGTPHGVGFARTPPVWLKAGDTVTIDIEKIGALTNPVINEPM